MYTFLLVLIIVLSIALCLIVLIQKSKGGGLASGFSSTNQIMGVPKMTDPSIPSDREHQHKIKV